MRLTPGVEEKGGEVFTWLFERYPANDKRCILCYTANLRFSGDKIHAGAREGDEPSGQIVTNFLTACENTVLQVRKEIIGIIIYSFTMWVTPKCPFFPMLEKPRLLLMIMEWQGCC